VFYVNKHYIQHYKRERSLNFRKDASGFALLFSSVVPVFAAKREKI
jgi:hypothetical protein